MILPDHQCIALELEERASWEVSKPSFMRNLPPVGIDALTMKNLVDIPYQWGRCL